MQGPGDAQACHSAGKDTTVTSYLRSSSNNLQASIEYLRYLEKCVTDLQAQHNSPRPAPPMAAPRSMQEDDDDDDDQDEEMEDDEVPAASTPATTAQVRSGSLVSLPSLSQMTSASTTSPSIFPTGRHYSVSSTSQASYSPYFHSTHTSPAFGPQLAHMSNVPGSTGTFRETFGLGSPALQPLDSAQHMRQVGENISDLADKRRPKAAKTGRSEHELDQEATAALLMLNHDRRSWQQTRPEGGPVRTGTGMSVRDLLSG